MVLAIAVTIDAQRIGVLEFNYGSGLSVADSRGVSAIFITHFSPEGYTLVERTRIEQVIAEQKLQRGNITESQMVRIGRILNVRHLVIGDITMAMGQYNVDVRVVNVQTGAIVAKDGISWVSGTNYRGMMECLATRLANKLPSQKKEVSRETPPLKIEETVQSFPGGSQALNNYLSANLQSFAREHGRVVAKFVVEKDGSITNIQIQPSGSKVLEKEVFRVVNNMPNWIPARQNGNPVRFTFTLPVNFP